MKKVHINITVSIIDMMKNDEIIRNRIPAIDWLFIW